MQPKKTKRQTQGPTGLCELFPLTVPIEEVARWQYKTVQIIFPLNFQTITITLDVVKYKNSKICLDSESRIIILSFLTVGINFILLTHVTKLIGWIGFSGTFSTIRLYRALKVKQKFQCS